MRILPVFIVVIACLIASNAPALANDESMARKKAQQAIDACWAISSEDRDSGNTSRMRSGTLNSALCMRDHIIHLSETVLFPNDEKLQQEIKENLEKIKSGTGSLYWNLHNSHDVCSKSPCGTINHLFHNSEIADEMEKIIKDFYRKISEFEQYQQHLNQLP